MKSLKITLIALLTIITVNLFATENVRIFHDAEYMDKYYYKVENLSAYDYHIAYHIYTSNTDRIILNMSMSSYKTLDAATTAKTVLATSINWDKTLVNKINSGLSTLEIVFQDEASYLSYEVSSAIFVSETEDKLAYSGAYYSFSYYKNKAYNPGSDLDGGFFPAYDDQVVFMNNNVDTRDCFREFELIKVVKETHPKGSFTMIANNDFTKLNSSDVMETCQSALYIDYVENVGIVEERTKNGKITLVGINDLKLDDYLGQSCGAAPTNLPVVTNTSTPPTVTNNVGITNQPKGEPGLNFYTRGENTSKSGEIKKPTSKNTNTVVTNNSATVEDDYIILFDMESNNNTSNNLVAKNQAKGTTSQNIALPTTKVVHIVDNGETLYGIAKKYDVSVLDIQQMNNLPDSKIDVTQELVIYRKK